MYEYFYLDTAIHGFFECCQVRLPREYNTIKADSLHHHRARDVVDAHLRAGMHG